MTYWAVGTCSWADESMVKSWYPKEYRSSENRLQYYSTYFDTVEVDSTFYALPKAEYCARWDQSTPDDFVFHIKAFGLMTDHSVQPSRLPPKLREYNYELTRFGNVKNPPPRMIRESFDLFVKAIEPIRSAGKLGVVLFQFPPYFTATSRQEIRRNLAWIRRSRELMAGYDLAVEFRHSSWSKSPTRGKLLRFLRQEGLSLVSVDEPQTGQRSFPKLIESTGRYGYIRFHGRNRANWNRRTESAAERFKYRYSEDELREWVDDVAHLCDATDKTFVMFNNCYADYAPTNALDMKNILLDENL